MLSKPDMKFGVIAGCFRNPSLGTAPVKMRVQTKEFVPAALFLN